MRNTEAKSRMFWKGFQYALFLFVLLIAMFSTYSWLDTAVSLSFARSQQKYDRERSELLRQFVLVQSRGAKRTEIARLIKENFAKGHVVKEQPEEIVVDDVIFRFDSSQSLSQIQFMNEATQ